MSTARTSPISCAARRQVAGCDVRRPDRSRLRLLQTLAQYGRERLAASGELDATRLRHARYFAAALDIPDAEHGSAERNWFARFIESIDDVRARDGVVARERDTDLALAIANGLGWYWNMGGRIDDTWRWMTTAFALPEPADPAANSRPRMGGRARHLADNEHAMAYGAEAVERARALGDPGALATATMLHGTTIADFFQHRVRSVPLLEESAAAIVAVGDDWSLAMAALLRGALARRRRLRPRARRAPRRRPALRGARQSVGRSYGLRHLADVLVVRGHTTRQPPRCTMRSSGSAPSAASA